MVAVSQLVFVDDAHLANTCFSYDLRIFSIDKEYTILWQPKLGLVHVASTIVQLS